MREEARRPVRGAPSIQIGVLPLGLWGWQGSEEQQWGPGSLRRLEVTGCANGLDVGDRERMKEEDVSRRKKY